jgi:hypothetical protein
MALSAGDATTGTISGTGTYVPPTNITSVGDSADSAMDFASGGTGGVIGTFSSPGYTLGSATTQTYEQQLYAQQLAAQAAAEAAARQAAIGSFNTGRANTYSGATNAASGFVRNQGNNILNYIDSLKASQQSVDEGRINAELGKQRGTQGVMSMVGRGIRSGGAMLANRNAGDSSATGAIARAYGDLGQREQSNVNNQFATDARQLDMTQEGINTGRNSAKRQFNLDNQNTVDSITRDAEAAFQSLNDAAAGAGILERIQIEQEKEAIRSQTLAKLAELDASLGGIDTVGSIGQDAARSQATQRNAAGAVGGENYSYNTEAPMGFQGAQVGQLPIYSNRRNRRA